jgi:hypothetical protein
MRAYLEHHRHNRWVVKRNGRRAEKPETQVRVCVSYKARNRGPKLKY